jgi:hypothetical protein
MLPDGLAELALLLVVLAVLVLVLRVGQSRSHTVRLLCPQGRGVVTCTLMRSDDGPWEAVSKCSAFGDADVRCSRDCLSLLNQDTRPEETR